VATFDAIILDLILVDLSAGSDLITGAAASANVNSGGFAIITRMLTSGAGTILSGVTTDDVRWIFSNNDDIRDTNPDALLSLTANATETTISTVNTPVLVAGTWVVESTSQFTGTTAGRVTYDGVRDLRAPTTIQATIEAASGTNKDITMYVAKNGTIISAAQSKNKVGANDPRTLSVPWQVDYGQTDFVEIFVENNTDSVNLVVVSAIIRTR
jgi:hypothetical protein